MACVLCEVDVRRVCSVYTCVCRLELCNNSIKLDVFIFSITSTCNNV